MLPLVIIHDISLMKFLTALPSQIPSAERWSRFWRSNSDLGFLSLGSSCFLSEPFFSIPCQLHHANYCFLVSIKGHAKSNSTCGSIIPLILKLLLGKAFNESTYRMNLQSLQLW